MTGMAKQIASGATTQIPDALAFLTSWHEKLNALFNLYSDLTSTSEKNAMARQLCSQLRMLIRTETELLLPVISDCAPGKALTSLLVLHHSTLIYLMDELQQMDAESSVFDIKVQILGKQVYDQYQEKQRAIFSAMKKSEGMDFWRLGTELVRLKKSFLTAAQPAV